jgi:hypothetical protein
VDNQGG